MSGCHVKPEQIFNLIFGYNDRWAHDLSGVVSGDGAYSASVGLVDDTEIYVAQFVYIRNRSGQRGDSFIRFHDGTDMYYAALAVTPTRYTPLIWNGSVPMKYGDQVYVKQDSCLNNDVMEAGVWGYKMKLTQ